MGRRAEHFERTLAVEDWDSVVQRAIAAAQSKMWEQLSPRERTQAIYREIRRLDLEYLRESRGAEASASTPGNAGS